MKLKRTRLTALFAIAATVPMAVHGAIIDVVATQTVNTTPFGVNVDAITADTTWTSDNIYILKDKVFVTNGATLTIEPGTKIYSTLDNKGTPSNNDDEFGSLVITRGAKINACGTAERPIVFTTIDELEAETQTDYDGDTFVAEAPTASTSGRWGGIVVLGSAPIATYTTGPTNVGENRIEGFQPAASADLDGDGRSDVIEYGGAIASDDSGALKYISIRHGGYVYAGSNEINGLTLGGVGNGTEISHIEVFANKDDGIEFFGGTVNTSHILLAFNFDDSFDIDEGYNGTNQFWFAVQNPLEGDGTTRAYDNGGEWDGVTGTLGDYADNSAPTIYNATFVGAGTGVDALYAGSVPSGNDKGNNAIYLDDRFKGMIYNSVFDDFARDVIGSAGDGPGTGLTFAHNTVGRFGGGTPGTNLSYVSDSGAANTFFNGSGTPINGNSAGGVNPLYSAYERNSALELEVLDPRPSSSSPLWVTNGATLQAGAPVTVNFRGAFGNENWAAGWTRYDQLGYLTSTVDVIAEQTVNTTPFGVNVDAITVDTTWTADKIYILKDKVFVTNGATLTIEPGTKIYSTLDNKGTPSNNDDEFGSLVITRGAKIMAEGTAESPIIFTAIDELEAERRVDLDGDGVVAEMPTSNTSGRWGGIVVLGSAPIATYTTGPTNVGENRIEGFQPAASADSDGDGRSDVIEYGGANSADDSGVLKYISIRHGGYVYAGSNEINGLTLGGVGNGTEISHIEVYANKDDGIEFFGGSVNTSHIVLAFNFDDSFDIDEGYNGTNQFWFAIQNPLEADGTTRAYDNGGEWDGVTGTLGDYANNSAPTIYNATFIGTGTGVDAEYPGSVPSGNDKGNNAIYLDDRFKGKIYNSVFDDFARDVVGSASDGPGTGLVFAYNTVGRFGGGSYTGTNASNLSYVSDSGAANTFFNGSGSPINGNSNGGVNPAYTVYERNEDFTLAAIDPRPSSNSPLWVGSAKLQPGAPVATTYRGAFGSENWAAGWTKMSQTGELLGFAPASGSGEPPFADVDADGISDTLEATPALAGLGFTVGANNAALFAALYTETSIQDLRGTGLILQKTGSNVNLTLDIESSDTLSGWVPAGTMTGTITGVPEDKQFFRLKID
jgi:uncharacterized membrane protein